MLVFFKWQQIDYNLVFLIDAKTNEFLFGSMLMTTGFVQ